LDFDVHVSIGPRTLADICRERYLTPAGIDPLKISRGLCFISADFELWFRALVASREFSRRQRLASDWASGGTFTAGSLAMDVNDARRLQETYGSSHIEIQGP
jgi:hypothetical protein